MTDASGGIDRELLVAEPSEFLVCKICHCVPTHPVEIATCGHLSCNHCITTWIGTNPVCPVDRATVQKHDLRSSSFAALQIAALTMRCPNHERGCSATFTIGKEGVRCKEHLEVCDQQLLKCSLCTSEVARVEMKSHVESKCLERPMECKHCDIKLRASELEGHLLPSGPLPCKGLAACPNGCDVKTRAVSGAVFASALQQHLERCPKQEVLCDMCQLRLPRGKLEAHFNEGLGEHMGFLLSKLARLTAENAQLQKQVAAAELVERKREPASIPAAAHRPRLCWATVFPSAVLSDGDSTVTLTRPVGNTSIQLPTFIAGTALERGVHTWRVVVRFLNPRYTYACVGVVAAQLTATSHGDGVGWKILRGGQWVVPHGYAVDIGDGERVSHTFQQRSQPFCTPWIKLSGNVAVVRVVLDLDRRTLQYFDGDTFKGVAFDNVQGPVRPAVAFDGNSAGSVQFVDDDGK